MGLGSDKGSYTYRLKYHRTKHRRAFVLYDWINVLIDRIRKCPEAWISKWINPLKNTECLFFEKLFSTNFDLYQSKYVKKWVSLYSIEWTRSILKKTIRSNWKFCSSQTQKVNTTTMVQRLRSNNCPNDYFSSTIRSREHTYNICDACVEGKKNPSDAYL